MNRSGTTAARCARLLQLFLLRGKMTSSEVARALDVPIRTARADLKLLASVAPITSSGDGRDREWVLDPADALGQVTILDRISLQLGKEVASFLQGTALHEGLERLDNDARGEPTGRYAAHLDRKFRHLGEPARSYADRSEVLDAVLDALLRERALGVVYQTARVRRVYEELQPLTLVVYRRALYLLAREGEGGRVLRLAVDWISEPTLGPRFDYPETWNPDHELAVSFGILADGEPCSVVLRFAPRMRRFLEVRRWHPSATMRDLDDGRVELKMWTKGKELVRFCLEWGENVEVVEPAWLREAVVAELEGALRVYGRG